jgi:hypothetical protein
MLSLCEDNQTLYGYSNEHVFRNVEGAQESIPPVSGTVPQIGLSYRPARLGIDSPAPLKGLQIRALYSYVTMIDA